MRVFFFTEDLMHTSIIVMRMVGKTQCPVRNENSKMFENPTNIFDSKTLDGV